MDQEIEHCSSQSEAAALHLEPGLEHQVALRKIALHFWVPDAIRRYMAVRVRTIDDGEIQDERDLKEPASKQNGKGPTFK